VVTGLLSLDFGDGSTELRSWRRLTELRFCRQAYRAQIVATGLRSSDHGNGLRSSDCAYMPMELRLWRHATKLRLWRQAYEAQSAQIVVRATELRSPDHGTFNHNTKPYPLGSLLIRRLQFTYRGSRSDMLLVLEFLELI
jgi:hypothetical protein